jgi:glycerol kinase
MSPTSALILPDNGLAMTVAWQLDGRTTYAIEGNISVTGSAIDWCTEMLDLRDASETIALAATVPSSDGVYVVPAFVGLGAPYWKDDARGLITGITRRTTAAHIARAVLESVAFQVRDVFVAMAEEMQAMANVLLADGGASRSDTLMQIQADVLGRDVLRNNAQDLSALGAAYAAGLGLGIWSSTDEIAALPRDLDRFETSCTDVEREEKVAGWRVAVARTMFSTDPDHAPTDAQSAPAESAPAQTISTR